MSSNVLKAFAASNLLIETNLRRIQSDYEIDLGKDVVRRENFRDLRLQFGLDIFADSERMSRYYGVFYCIERQARKIVSDILSDKFGATWWVDKVPEDIKTSVAKRMKTDLESGMAMRSTEPIDYTTFGEVGIILDKFWNQFSDVFTNRSALKKVFTTLNLLRGPIAHNSMFVESEAERFNIVITDWIRLQK